MDGAAKDQRLLDYARRLNGRDDPAVAAHIHLSALRASNRRDHHIRIAVSTLESLVRRWSGQIFDTSSGDLIVSCRGATREDVEAVVAKLRNVFRDDPIVRASDEGDGPRFCTMYDMTRDHARFLDMALGLAHASAEAEGGEPPSGASAASGAGADHTLDPAILSRLEQTLVRADLSNVVRRQAVCAVAKGTPPRPLFNEVFVSIGELASVLTPDTDLGADPWLFQRLTRLLDLRVLQYMRRNDDSELRKYFSLNLNVPTVLAPEFLKFDEEISSGARGTIVIELHILDVFSDLASYAFARDVLQERKYRVCLDGIDHRIFPYVDRRRLGGDLIKVQWNPEMVDAEADLVDAIKRAEAQRVILTRCDSPESINFGLSLGLGLFQGHLVDSLRSRAAAASGSTRATGAEGVATQPAP